jgi:hypothetical protein
MAKKTGISNAAAEMKEFNKESASLVVVLKDLAKALKDNAEAASKFTGESVEAYTESTKEAIDLAKQLQGYTIEQLKNRKSQTSFEDKLSKLQQNQARVASKITFLEEKRLSATKQEKVFIDKSLITLKETANTLEESSKHSEKLSKAFQKINEQTKFFDGMSDLVRDVPILSNVFKDFQRASDAARDAASEGGSALAAGGKVLAGFAGKAIAAFAVGNLVKGVNLLDERTTSVARNLNKSRSEAMNIVTEFDKASQNIAGITGPEMVKSAESFADALGTTAVISAEDAVNFATMTNKLGLATNEAAKLETLSLAIDKSSKSITQNIIGEVRFSNYRNKSAVDYKKVLKDVGNANAAILLSVKGQGKGLGDAGAAARRLGLDLNKVDAIASSLLNFEESISSELEAELLTGRDLNLEEARRFALNGDIAGLTAEIAKNVGNAEQFGKMNRLQQEAIAKSVGMTREELASSLMEQEALTKLGAKDAKQRDEIIEAEMARVKQLQSQGKFAEAEVVRKQLVNKLGSEELTQQIENRSMAELQLEASTKMATAMNDISVNILPKISSFMEKIVGSAEMLATIFTAIGGLVLFNKIANMSKILGGIGKIVGKTGSGLGKLGSKTLGGIGKIGSGLGKLGGKSLLKKIPIIGALAGIGFAVKRLAEGDILGAAGEAASGLAGTIPGIGTAASIGIDSALAFRDTPMATGGIVTRPTRALVGEAGNEAVIPLDKFYAKLDELIAAVKAGGHVYLDGTKVGTAMNVSTYRVQ